jgi:hypothetical protein
MKRNGAKKRYWFKAKLHGWGWTPATWEGYLTLILYALFIVRMFYQIDKNSHSVSDTLLNFIPNTILLTFMLIVFCYFKGEEPRFRWGSKGK